jgi:iron complex transport system ATP-binding protein
MTLCAEGVTVARGGRTLLHGVDVALCSGEVLAVVGPNGAGKSTLLGALAGDLSVNGGQVLLDEQPLAQCSLAQRARRRAVVGPPPQMAFDFTVEDVVSMGWLHGELHGQALATDALAQVLRRCELEDMRQRVFMSLSSGERQRAQFAAGWLQIWPVPGEQASRWLLLDEPTANLDVAHALQLLSLLREIAAQGVGVLVVLHDLDLAARYADRVLLLEQGRVVSCGLPEQVMTGPRLSAVYGTPIHVERLPALDRLVVIA